MPASQSHHFMSELKAPCHLTVVELSKAHHKTCQATDEGQLQTDFFRYAQSPEELCHGANLQTNTRPLFTPQFQHLSAVNSIPSPDPYPPNVPSPAMPTNQSAAALRPLSAFQGKPPVSTGGRRRGRLRFDSSYPLLCPQITAELSILSLTRQPWQKVTQDQIILVKDGKGSSNM